MFITGLWKLGRTFSQWGQQIQQHFTHPPPQPPELFPYKGQQLQVRTELGLKSLDMYIHLPL